MPSKTKRTTISDVTANNDIKPVTRGRGRPPKTAEEKAATRRARGERLNICGVSDGESGDNTRFVMVSMQLCSLPDIDLKNPEQVQNRINEFFTIMADNDIKPTVAGLGLALNGLDRRRLYEIRTGRLLGGHTRWDLPPETVVSIQKAYKIMENLWESYMQNGKINPVSGIFLGKNNYGYQDRTEHVITPDSREDSDYSEEDIAKRYMLDDSGQIETDFAEE